MNIKEITDFSAPELDVYARLSEAQLLNRDNPKDGIFIAESPKVIERALDNGYSPISVLIETKHINGEGKTILSRIGNIPVYTAEFDVLTKLTGFKLTRGMLCAMHRRDLIPLSALLENVRRVAVLENVMNPTNVGAIIRSAAALNIDCVVLTSSCSNPLYRRAIRVSMGTVFQIPWTICDDNTPWLEILKERGFKTAAMALTDNSINIDEPHLKSIEKLAIILGTEGDGLCEDTIKNCDYTVKIPMSHDVDSLNVAAASAVAFWQFTHQNN